MVVQKLNYTFVYNFEKMAAINLEEFFDSKSLDKLAELYVLMTKESLSVKDTGINYRVINHWDEKGLIRFARNSTEGYRKFSLVDFIWIKVVNELREFGVNLPDIQKITNDLYEPLPIKDFLAHYAQNLNILSEYEGKEDLIEFLKSGNYENVDYSLFRFNFLQILIAEAIATRKPISLLLFKNGEWLPYNPEKESAYPEEILFKKEYASHIFVSLTDIIFRHIVEDELSGYLEGINIFTQNELAVIKHLKDEDYSKIVVVLKDKAAAHVEVRKDSNAKNRIMKIIRLKEYKEFVVFDNENNEHRIGKTKIDRN